MPSLPSLIALVIVLQGVGTAPVRVDIDGVSGEIRRNIRAHLAIYQRRADPDLPESTVRALHGRAPSEIRAALRPFGYYRPVIRSELGQRDDGWRARYRIDPGPPVRYTVVDVELSGEGADDAELRSVFPQPAVRTGAPLRHPAWERGKQALLNRAAARGYLDARLTRSRVEVDTAALSARALLRLETGPRYRFGDVRLDPTPFDRALVDRFVVLVPGEPFSLDALLETQRLLRASEYFQRVQVEPLRDSADGLAVPIRIELEPRPRTQYTVGAGYGTDTGVRGRGSWQRRWLNDAGHRAQAEARAAVRAQAVQVQYVVPLSGGASDRVAVTSAVQRESFEGLESRLISARAEWDHGRFGWREVVSIRLAEEWFRDGEDRRTSTLLVPEISWSRVRGDDVLYPRRGSRVQLGLSGASRALVSDVGFARATADLLALRGLHRSGRVLVRASLGTVWVDDLQELPVSFRLFAGGDRSVRGFAYRSIGPGDVDGSVTGGRHRAVGSVEVEQMVRGPVGLAVFVDAGNVFEDRVAIALDRLEYGAGLGVRWRSPFGPVRADVAWPVSRSGDGPRLHFVVGGVL